MILCISRISTIHHYPHYFILFRRCHLYLCSNCCSYHFPFITHTLLHMNIYIPHFFGYILDMQMYLYDSLDP